MRPRWSPHWHVVRHARKVRRGSASAQAHEGPWWSLQAPQVRNKGTRGHPGAGGCGARGRGPRGEARGAAGARIKKANLRGAAFCPI